MKSREIWKTNLKPYLFNPSVCSFCFRVPSIIINMTDNQWLVTLLLARQLISETSDPFNRQPVWHPVIIHCRCDRHRRIKLVDTNTDLCYYSVQTPLTTTSLKRSPSLIRYLVIYVTSSLKPILVSMNWAHTLFF